MTEKIVEKLKSAKRHKHIVSFRTPYESGSVDGYVLGIGKEFFLVAILGDGFRYDGYACFRIKDVRGLEVPSKRSDVYERVLKARKLKTPATPPLRLGSLRNLLISANKHFPLVTIATEKQYPNECYIGRIVSITDKHLSLLEIDADASWDETPYKYALNQITNVRLGSDYQNGLNEISPFPNMSAFPKTEMHS